MTKARYKVLGECDQSADSGSFVIIKIEQENIN